LISALQAGYAVIFLNRKTSVQPFTAKQPESSLLEALLNCLQFESSSDSNSSAQPAEASRVAVRLERQPQLAAALKAATAAKEGQTLLSVPFETIFEYLQVGLTITGPLHGDVAFFWRTQHAGHAGSVVSATPQHAW
jgi:hypothetical protein